MNKIGPYTLVRPLAQGGMADVLLGMQTGLGGFQRNVVVKRVRACFGDNPQFAAMIRREARISSRLQHLNIVQIIDVVDGDAGLSIVMEHLDGQDLLSVLKRARELKRFLPIAVAVGIATQMLAGLSYAHALSDEDGRPLGLVHRDISPANLMVTHGGTVKLIDFGIAKATLDGNAPLLTNAGHARGKAGYMAPEQVRCQPVDARTDVFATGIVLWEMLTGRRLWRRTSDVDTMLAICREEAPPASEHAVGVPPELEKIVARALERDPTRRFASAAEMSEALEEWLRSQGLFCDELAVGRWVRALFAADLPASSPSPSEIPTVITQPRPRAQGRWRRWLAVAALVVSALAFGGLLAS